MSKNNHKDLTLKQQLFCKYYLEGKGNGVNAVIKAGYNLKKKNGVIDRKLAKSIASENLTKPDIIKNIQKELEDFGFTDANIMKHHLFLIEQFSDLSVKAKAIDMYYKKTGAYAETKLEIKDPGYRAELDAALDRIRDILPTSKG